MHKPSNPAIPAPPMTPATPAIRAAAARHERHAAAHAGPPLPVGTCCSRGHATGRAVAADRAAARPHDAAAHHASAPVIRPAGPEDRAAALALHNRCSLGTLYRRYHGPVSDADRYLDHLLDPRHGQTLAVQSASGRLIALGHLLWDGEETEVALLVEDEWQRRGIGGRLLRRLVALAVEADRTTVYAVTGYANTAMIAAMRALPLPLDHQVQDGTLVITATLRPSARDARPETGRTAARGR